MKNRRIHLRLPFFQFTFTATTLDANEHAAEVEARTEREVAAMELEQERDLAELNQEHCIVATKIETDGRTAVEVARTAREAIKLMRQHAKRGAPPAPPTDPADGDSGARE